MKKNRDKFKQDEEFKDKLQSGGINSMGFGNIAKAIMVDRRLNDKAKTIYAYLASYCGGGTTAFPSVKKICNDLNINRDTFYFYLLQLKAYGYIKVINRSDVDGKFTSNIYVLEPNPIIDKKSLDELNRQIQKRKDNAARRRKKSKGLQDIRKPYPNRSDTVNPDTVGSAYNNNNNNSGASTFSYYSVDDRRENCQSVSKISHENLIKIKKQCQLWLIEGDMQTSIEEAIDRMYYADPLQVGNSQMPQEMVRSRMELLNRDIIEYAIRKLKTNTKNTARITNVNNYYMSVIYNAITEYHAEEYLSTIEQIRKEN